jgi:hypothetical protein
VTGYDLISVRTSNYHFSPQVQFVTGIFVIFMPPTRKSDVPRRYAVSPSLTTRSSTYGTRKGFRTFDSRKSRLTNMRRRTNAEANAEARPARVSSRSPTDSPHDGILVVAVSLAKIVLADDIFKLSSSGGDSDSKGREHDSKSWHLSVKSTRSSHRTTNPA